MSRIVMKFGGTSVGDLTRINRVARIIAAQMAEGAKQGLGVAVAVSAMSGETNRLLSMADQIDPDGLADERDVVVSSGEQVSVGLLALALRKLGLRARSWLGWQAGVDTTPDHGQARITGFDAGAIGAAIDDGEVAVLAGFQGRGPDGRVTTLGRGGTDLSAVALAAALNADRCDIYTDVDGVYTTDPRVAKKAQRIEKISFEEMLEMASMGAKVLHTRSVELAMARAVPLRVLSSFPEPGEERGGTLICKEDASMEKRVVSGIAYTKDEVRVTVFGVPDKPGFAAAIFATLAEAGANVDMIVQNPSAHQAGSANIAFTVGHTDHGRCLEVLESQRDTLGFSRLEAQTDLGKVSVVGFGMRSHTGVAHTMFGALAEKRISIEAISTSEIKISALVSVDYIELAVRSLHTAFGLDAE